MRLFRSTSRQHTRIAASVGAVAILVASLLASCSNSSENDSKDGVVLKLGYFLDATRAQVDQSGLFEDTPYELEWVQLTDAPPQLAALSSGQIDVSWLLGLANVYGAAANETPKWTPDTAPFKIVSILDPTAPQENPVIVVGARKDSGINSLNDLAGHTVGYTEGTDTESVIKFALDRQGLDSSAINGVSLEATALPAALVSGQIDAAAVGSSQLNTALAEGGANSDDVKIIATDADAGYTYRASIVATSNALNDAKKRPAIDDLVTRITKFQQWTLDNPDKAAQAYVQTLGLTPQQAASAAASLQFNVSAPTPDNPLVQLEQDRINSLIKLGLIPDNIDSAAVFDDSLSESIAAAKN